MVATRLDNFDCDERVSMLYELPFCLMSSGLGVLIYHPVIL
jgi:hypothetical protein